MAVQVTPEAVSTCLIRRMSRIFDYDRSGVAAIQSRSRCADDIAAPASIPRRERSQVSTMS
jgi:hypothetical protein